MRPLILRRREPAEAPRRRDPAPSRWAYKMHRLWLTPMFRALVRVGLPAFVLAFGVGLWLSDADRRAVLAEGAEAMRTAFHQRPEFMVNLIAIEGATGVLAESIRGALALDLPRSSFEIDLVAARGTVESFDAVARADLRVVQGGVLQVNVTERLPAVVWRTRDGLWLLDAEGHRIAVITARGLRADLPLVAGKGASDATPEALALFKVAEPLSGRVRGLVRVGERRWDLVLDRDQRILLPEMQPERALERVIALDQAQGLLARDLLAVDLRNERRPTVRVNPEALDHLRPAWTTVTPATAMTMTETRP